MYTFSLKLNLVEGNDGMGWLEFISSMTSSVAWPIAAVAIAVIFRHQINSLIQKIRRLSWGDSSIDFTEKLDEAENVATEISQDENIPEQQIQVPSDRFNRLMHISPSAAVVDAWVPIEKRLKEIEKSIGYEQRRVPRVLSVTSHLLRNEKISSSVYELIREMQDMRNAAAHEADISQTDAIRFFDISQRVLSILNSVDV